LEKPRSIIHFQSLGNLAENANTLLLTGCDCFHVKELEIFTIFFGPPSPKAVAGQGHLIHHVSRLKCFRGSGPPFKLKGKMASENIFR